MKRCLSIAATLLVWLSIVLPVFMIVFEARTHQCSGALFDPMPTPWHLVLLLTLPVANALTLVSFHSTRTWLHRITAIMRGIALVPAIFYMIAVGKHHLLAGLLLLITPLGVFSDGLKHLMETSLWVEWPLLGLATLAPLAGFLGWLIAGRRFRRRIGDGPSVKQAFSLQALGFLSGSVLLAAIEIPLYRTYSSIMTAAESVSGTREEDAAIEQLRRSNANAILLRLCYPPMQFSSAGGLYACGPVDVFGPLTHIMNGWKAPGDDLYSPIRNSQKMRSLFRTLTGNQDGDLPKTPTSWRGLSPWEVWQLKWHPEI